MRSKELDPRENWIWKNIVQLAPFQTGAGERWRMGTQIHNLTLQHEPICKELAGL